MADFKGFSEDTLTFLVELHKNNTKEWFEKNRKRYENSIKKPSTQFVEAMGEKLKEITPEINAIPKVNKSIFRINRDTRFSKDKSPYKTNIGIWFWEGTRNRMECPGFYFHFEPGKLLLGSGYYIFPKDLVDPYRNAIVDKKKGKHFQQTVKKLAKESISIGGKHYKRIPRGFDADHPNAEFLLYNGLHAGFETSIPQEFYSGNILDFSMNYFRKMYPLHNWLLDSLD